MRKDIPFASLTDSTFKEFQPVNIPHSWNTQDVLDLDPLYYMGVGWYKRNLVLDNGYKGKKVYLYFEGVNLEANVYLNGEKIGNHKGGYTAFCIDITDKLNWNELGSSNLLAVRADNAINNDISPLSADFTKLGGIYRDVWLMTSEQVHFDRLDHASSGVYIQTPLVSNEKAEVKVKAKLVNDKLIPSQLVLVNSISDKHGKEVKTVRTKVQLKAGQSLDITTIMNVENPQLWSPEMPTLYTVKTSIVDTKTNQVIDEVKNPLGFRWYRFDPNEGFFLNGAHYKLVGVNDHQDFDGRANAVPDEYKLNDVKLIKEMGINFVRVSHYPYDRSFLEACDKQGIITWMETPTVDQINPTKEFFDNCKFQQLDMIKQYYNHPSVVMWGYMNEILMFMYWNKPNAEYLYTKVLELAKQLDSLTLAEDPYRVTVMACHPEELYNRTKIADVPMVIGWNLYHGWYYSDNKEFGVFMDTEHKNHPNRCHIISEYGAGSADFLHADSTIRQDYSAEAQQNVLEGFQRQISERPYIAGSAVWNFADFNSSVRREITPNYNNKGLVNHLREPKDVYYFYQSKLTTKPLIHIATKGWTNRIALADNGDSCKTQVLKVYTNLPELELFHNGKSLGVKKIKEYSVSWKVAFVKGDNHMIAKSTDGSQLIDFKNITMQLYPNKFDENFEQLAVNVGSNCYYVDPRSGLTWLPDKTYSSGNYGYIDADTIKSKSLLPMYNIIGTNVDGLFRHHRENLKSYKIDVPNGTYEVEIGLLHPLKDKVFNVLVNNELIYKYEKSTNPIMGVNEKKIVEVTDGKGININFQIKEGTSVLSSVYVKKMY